STKLSGSNPFTSPAMRQLNCDASKEVMGPMPLVPFLIASQTVSVPIPTEVNMPTPVTTTLRCCKRELRGLDGLGLLLGLDVVDRVLGGGDLLRVFVGDVEVECFLERHDQLDYIQRVGAEIIDKARVGIDLRLVHAELLDDDLLDLLLNGHASSRLFL